ncbi:hypothetical protein F4860DRAFT_460993 [Xylaria cubensis]|nr:hypothetical protein F4860DRAFT_460993 [Xylaria cubensis]
MTQNATPFEDLKVLKHQIPAYNLIPNTSIQRKPLLNYKSAFPSAMAPEVKLLLFDIGVVKPLPCNDLLWTRGESGESRLYY